MDECRPLIHGGSQAESVADDFRLVISPGGRGLHSFTFSTT